jgi:hypothetical protein
MAVYKETEKGQGLFLEVNLCEQILPGTFEWTMSRFIAEEVDFSVFDTKYNNDETGAPAIDPRIMLKAFLYGYANGQKSLRSTGANCRRMRARNGAGRRRS